MTRRLSAFGSSRPSAARLAPSGPRPNALPLHNVRYRRPERTTEDRNRLSPAVRPSSRQALARPTKLINCIGRIRERLESRSTLRRNRGLDLGGARRDRTDDLMLAKHALSQLSYGPVQDPPAPKRPVVVGLGGLEPPTSRLSSARSNQLSYKPGRKKKSTPLKPATPIRRREVFRILRRKRDEGGASRKTRPDWPLDLSRTTNRRTKAKPKSSC